MNKLIENAVDSIFGCPIFVNDAEETEFQTIQSEITQVLPELVKSITDDESPKYFGTLASNYPWDNCKNGNKLNLNISVNIIHEYKLDNLKKYIFKCIGNYLTKIEGRPCQFNIKDSWLVEMKKGGYVGKHHHGMSHISGVYYYSTDENSGMFTVFPPQSIHPFPSEFVNSVYYKHSIHYTPKNGRLILIPGWTEHCVTECKSDILRYSIPFNINLTLL
jgi:uncharacterized protein (TIGR02466 family)